MAWRAYLLQAVVWLWSVYEKLTAKAAFLGLAQVNLCCGGALTLEWSCRSRISASTAPCGNG